LQGSILQIIQDILCTYFYVAPLSYKKAENVDVFRQHLEDGLNSATEIAEEMGVTKGYLSKLAKRAANEGRLSISKGKYKLEGSY